ncbi:MAG: DUF423 domain-containing protein [Pseudomonadota bacterium]
MNDTTILKLGGFNAVLAIAAGAFGAHGLRDQVAPALLRAFETGAQYHFYHALGLIAVGLTIRSLGRNRMLTGSTWCMLAGIALFSGSLYALALTGIRALGAITPIGGTLWIVAWCMFAIGCRKPD